MNKNHDQLYKDQKFLDRHADELDELLREASAAVSTRDEKKKKSYSLAQQRNTDNDDEFSSDNTNDNSKSLPVPPQKSPLVSFSTYSNVAPPTSVDPFLLNNNHTSTSAALNSSSSSTLPALKSSQEHRNIRLRPIDVVAGGKSSSSSSSNKTSSTSMIRSSSGNTKALKKAQKAEQQWYRQNVLLPQQQAEEEAKARQQRELKLKAKQEAEEQKRLENLRPLDPSRYWMLQGTRGSLVPDARTLHSVVAFEDRLYVFGGEVSTASGTGGGGGSNTNAATVVSDDFFVASGLSNTHGVQWAPVDVLTNTTTNNTKLPTKPLPRSQHSMVVLPQRAESDAALFLFGGVGPNGRTHLLGDSWLFLIESRRWQFIPSLPSTPAAAGTTSKSSSTKQLENNGVPSPRCGHSCAVLKKRYAFVFGGRILKKSDPSLTKVSNELFVFDSSLASSSVEDNNSYQNCWLKMPGNPTKKEEKESESNTNNAHTSWPCARYNHAASSSDENNQERMFIHGGIDSQGHTLTDLWFLDYSTRVWREVEGLSYEAIGAVPRSRHGIVALSMHQVMMFGGVSIIDAHAGRRIGHNNNSDQLFTASPGVVVNVCSEKQQTDTSNSNRYIVETVRSIPFVGNSNEIPDIAFHSFGGCAVSNGAAFVFSGLNPSSNSTIVSSSSAGVAQNSTANNNSSAASRTSTNGNLQSSSTIGNTNKGTVGRFALPLPKDVPLYESRSLFSLWASRRLDRNTSPIPHDIELHFPSSSSSSVYCHKSILQIRAPSLLQAIHMQCSFEVKQLGRLGLFSQTKYEIVPRRREKGLLDAPTGFCENKENCVGELIRFLYCGVFSENESRRIASSNTNNNSSSSVCYYSTARKYDIPSLTQYLNVLTTGHAENNNNANNTTTATIPNLATRRANAENFGLSSVIDDNFTAISGYTCPGDVTLVVEDPYVARKNGQLVVETVQVHSSIVACASSFLRNLLRGDENDGVKLEILPSSSSSSLNTNKTKRITGLKLPTGSALAAVIEHMYSGRGGSYSSDSSSSSSIKNNTSSSSSSENRLVHIGNAFEVSFIASKLDLPFLRATAERVVLDSLSPILEHPTVRGLCSNLALAAKYDCGRVYEVLITAISMRIHEVDPDLFISEIPLEAQEEILMSAKECFPQGSFEIDELQKEFDLKSKKKLEILLKQKRGNGNVTVGKSSAVYEERASAAHLRI